MTDWLDDYHGLSHDSSVASMIEIVQAGQRTWEHILLEPNRPWTPFVTDAQRAKLLHCLRDCYDAARAHKALRAQVLASR